MTFSFLAAVVDTCYCGHVAILLPPGWTGIYAMSTPLNSFINQTVMSGWSHTYAGLYNTDPCTIAYRIDNPGTFVRQDHIREDLINPLFLDVWSTN